jgi:hypothetical protein
MLHSSSPQYSISQCLTCLGDSEEILGGLNDTAEVGDAADAALDGVGVVVARGVQDVLDLGGVVVGKLLVHGADVVVDTEVDGHEREEDNGLLVDDVELVADGCDGKTSSGGKDTDLAGDGVTGQRVQDGLCDLLGLLLGDLGDLGSLLARRGGGREGRRGGAEGDRRAGPDGAWRGSVWVFARMWVVGVVSSTHGAFCETGGHCCGM